MRTYRRYIHCSQGVREDNNIIEIVLYYPVVELQLAAAMYVKQRFNQNDASRLSDEQLDEYDNFIGYIYNLIDKYNFEIDEDDPPHQSNKSYSYYFKFRVVDEDDFELDNHRIILRISNHPQKKQKKNPLGKQFYDSIGDETTDGKSFCEQVVVYPGNGREKYFNSIPLTEQYLDEVFETLYHGDYYGMRPFPVDSYIPEPFSDYFRIVRVKDFSDSDKYQYTYEYASDFVDTTTMEPQAWAEPSAPYPYKEVVDSIGRILIVKEKSSDSYKVIAFNRGDRPYILSPKHFQSMIDEALRKR